MASRVSRRRVATAAGVYGSAVFGFVATMLMFFYYGPIIGVPQSVVPPRIRALTSAVTLLVFNLFGSAEDVRIILREPAYS